MLIYQLGSQLHHATLKCIGTLVYDVCTKGQSYGAEDVGTKTNPMWTLCTYKGLILFGQVGAMYFVGTATCTQLCASM